MWLPRWHSMSHLTVSYEVPGNEESRHSYRYKQEAQLSQRGRSMLRVCLYSQLQHTYSAVFKRLTLL